MTQETDLYLLPWPKTLRHRGRLALPAELAVALRADSDESDQTTANDLAQRLTGLGLKAAVTSERHPARYAIRLIRDDDLPGRLGEQGYRLEVDATCAEITARGSAGLFYGTRTLLQLIDPRAPVPTLALATIEDWPDIPYRAAHYDTKHHQDTAGYVRQLIRDLADYKINVLVWEWEDKFAYRSHPEIGAPGAFTLEEMQAFTAYARQYHIQLVPLVQGLGHASYILKWPRHAHLREIPASNWEFCPLRDETYTLLGDLWREAVEATPGSEFLHIGTDETYELGLGEDCGCKAYAERQGRRALLVHFLERAARELAPVGRRLMAWGGEYQPGDAVQPPEGLIVAEFTDELEIAKASRDAGYPAWVYDPNPGIEHLFLPYFERERGEPCLIESQRVVANAARSGLYEGMINTSWDDSGLHPQAWMLSFANSAAWAWNGSAPDLDAVAPTQTRDSLPVVDSFFATYYGPQARDLRELWTLLNRGAYFYMDSFERRVWHWGEIGKTHLPDLPRGDAVEYNPFWVAAHAEMISHAEGQLEAMERASAICQANLAAAVWHAHDMEVFDTVAALIAHTAHTWMALNGVEQAFGEAHRAHFVDRGATLAALERAAQLIEANLRERAVVFERLVAVWGETRLPKGLSLHGKAYLHRQDRARHFANRRADMTYLIYDEELLGLEAYAERLREYAATYLLESRE